MSAGAHRCRGLVLGRSRKTLGARQFAQVTTTQNRGQALVVTAEVVVRRRGHRSGSPGTAAATTGPPALLARPVQAAPGAEPRAKDREEGEHDEIPYRAFADAHLELVHGVGRGVPVLQEPGRAPGLRVPVWEGPGEPVRLLGQQRDRAGA